MTPEGKIKAAVKRKLNSLWECYHHWPVQNGMGAPALDYYGCFVGTFFAVETKAPGGRPTPRQEHTMRTIYKAGGLVFVVSNDTDIDYLVRCLEDQREYLFLNATGLHP